MNEPEPSSAAHRPPRWRQLAEAARADAERLEPGEVKESRLRLADTYDRLADVTERVERDTAALEAGKR